MRLCDVLRTAGWIAGSLWPEQAVRALRGRDFDAAVARTDDALDDDPFNPSDLTERERAARVRARELLNEAEESVEVWECGGHLAADVDDHLSACVSRAVDSPAAGERTPDNRPAAGRIFGKVERDAYFAGLAWPEPKAPEVESIPGMPSLASVLRAVQGDPAQADRRDQIEHVAAMVEVWLEEVGPTTTAQDLAARIVDMLAADKRIAERWGR